MRNVKPVALVGVTRNIFVEVKIGHYVRVWRDSTVSQLLMHGCSEFQDSKGNTTDVNWANGHTSDSACRRQMTGLATVALVLTTVTGGRQHAAAF